MSDLKAIDEAIAELEREARMLWANATTNSEFDRAKWLEEVSGRARSAYRRIAEKVPA